MRIYSLIYSQYIMSQLNVAILLVYHWAGEDLELKRLDTNTPVVFQYGEKKQSLDLR